VSTERILRNEMGKKLGGNPRGGGVGERKKEGATTKKSGGNEGPVIRNRKGNGEGSEKLRQTPLGLQSPKKEDAGK